MMEMKIIPIQLMMMKLIMLMSPEEKVAKVGKVAVREAVVVVQVRNARSLIRYKRRIWILYNSHLII